METKAVTKESTDFDIWHSSISWGSMKPAQNRLSVKIYQKDDARWYFHLLFPLSKTWTFICCSVCIVWIGILTPPSILFHSNRLFSFPSYQYSPNHGNKVKSKLLKIIDRVNVKDVVLFYIKTSQPPFLHISFPRLTATNRLKDTQRKVWREKRQIYAGIFAH